MKFVRFVAALPLTFVIACGGGDGTSVDGSSADETSNGLPSQDTTGASIVVPGATTSNETPNGASADSNQGTESAPASSDEAPAAPADPAAPTDPAPVAPAKPLYVPPECGADCQAHDIPGIVARASKKYGLPRWFYFAIIRRESSFDRCKTQPESAPNQDWGRGLTQVTFPWYAGVPFPQHLGAIDNANGDWRNNMGLNGSYGAWIDMSDITPIPSTPASESECRTNPKKDDAYDPQTNIDRFSSGFAAPAYHLFHVPGEDPAETLRKVAYHWHYGIWGSKSGDYPNDPRPYLTCATCYDTHVNEYRAPVEADDGVYAGPACKAPYKDSGC